MEIRLADEIERKTLETAEMLALRHEQGVLSDREYRIAMDAVWGCMSGLVKPIHDVMEQVWQIKPAPIRRVALKGDCDPIILERAGTVLSVYKPPKAPGEYRRSSVFDTEVEAVQQMNRLAERLEGKGYYLP